MSTTVTTELDPAPTATPQTVTVDLDPAPAATAETAAVTAAGPAPDARRGQRRLVATLRAALAAVAELDPDLLGSGTPAGRAAVPMAGTARSAIAVLGGDGGVALTHAPGVVVGRDLATVTTVLAATPAGDASASTARRLGDLAEQAEQYLDDLLRVVTRGA